MKKHTVFALASTFFILSISTVITHAQVADLSISARSAALYQPETDIFLYSKNADARLPMASTTKIMTAIVALENAEIDEIVTIGEESVGVEGSSAYLRVGERLTMEELIYALLLQSANDAAVAIAYHIGGDVEGFADMMNEKALDLDLSDTNFTNPHGLDDPQHYTTAKDLAKIAAEGLKNETFRQIVSCYKKTFANDDRSRTYVNHNKLLRLYEGCIGVKTGFTKKCGRCLVGASQRDGLTFISVTLNAPSDWSDHKKMLDFGYDKLERIDFTSKNEHNYEIPVIDGTSDSVSVTNQEHTYIITEKGEHIYDEHIKVLRYAIAPIEKGEILGEIIYTLDGKEVARVPLVAEKSVEKQKEKGFLHKILSIFI